jgi:hypothetical protein
MVKKRKYTKKEQNMLYSLLILIIYYSHEYYTKNSFIVNENIINFLKFTLLPTLIWLLGILLVIYIGKKYNKLYKFKNNNKTKWGLAWHHLG